MSSWDDYFWEPGTDVLRNLYGIRNKSELRIAEYRASADRAREIERGVATIARTYDAAHLRAIHRHLLQDVYQWAGQYRTVDMAHGESPDFALVSTIDDELREASHTITSTLWASLDLTAFADAIARVAAVVNYAHPFRDGNGRTYKLFLGHVAEQSHFVLDYSRVTPAEWNYAFELSMPRGREPHPLAAPLRRVVTRLAQPADAELEVLPTRTFGINYFPEADPPEHGIER